MTVEHVGPEAAAAVLGVVHEAFASRPPLDPPADALSETEESVAALLAPRGGLLARVDGEAVGTLVLDPVGTTMYLRRFGVLPAARGHGIATRLIDAAVEAAAGFDDLTVVAREELPGTVAFWDHQGFREISRTTPDVEMRRPLRTTVFHAPTPASMHQLGRSVAGQLGPGDLLVLIGGLGAGKTTFTQGLAAGLGVRGNVTSPTFVISRVHPSLVGGPALVHVDAYRLGGLAELDDLDLDTSLADAVTVVEWGEGIAEALDDSRLEIRIVRDTLPPADPDPAVTGGGGGVDDSDGDGDGDAEEGLDPRRVEVTPVGPRWHALSFRGLG